MPSTCCIQRVSIDPAQKKPLTGSFCTPSVTPLTNSSSISKLQHITFDKLVKPLDEQTLTPFISKGVITFGPETFSPDTVTHSAMRGLCETTTENNQVETRRFIALRIKNLTTKDPNKSLEIHVIFERYYQPKDKSSACVVWKLSDTPSVFESGFVTEKTAEQLYNLIYGKKIKNLQGDEIQLDRPTRPSPVRQRVPLPVRPPVSEKSPNIEETISTPPKLNASNPIPIPASSKSRWTPS